jgi:hydrogenase/urease accessory protein HupE
VADELAVEVRGNVECDGSLVGESIGVSGLDGPVTSSVVRIELADGRVVQGVVTATSPSIHVPARPSWWDVARTYGRLGVSHILTGYDHLLFVFGLILLAGTMRGILAAVSAFTAGHSVTLAAAVLGLVRVPGSAIEVAIAASVFALAVELARTPASPTLMRRRPWAMAGLFGLLHGLGFASALSEAGLPAGEVPLALLAFNLGVEAGQILFVGSVLAARVAAAPVISRCPPWSRQVPVYVMGALAAFWWLERAAQLVGSR